MDLIFARQKLRARFFSRWAPCRASPLARALPDALRHLPRRAVGNFALLVKVRRDVHQPRRRDLYHLTHVLFRREHELEVHDPSRELLREAAARVDRDRLRVLHRSVRPVFLQLGGVVKEPRRDALLDVLEVVPVAHEFDLDALQQTQQLIAYIPRASHASHLHEVLVAPLRAEVAVRPLRVVPYKAMSGWSS
eukprot:30718-Pelagococcus_subviridis.AAC.2